MTRPAHLLLHGSLRAALFVLCLATAHANEPAKSEPPEHEPAGPAAPETEAADAADAAKSSAEAQGLLKLGASLTDRGDYSAAEIAYRQILHSASFSKADQKDALLGLARSMRRQGAFTKAAAIYEKYLKEFPEDARTPDVLLDLGRTLRAMGAYKLAIARFYSVLNSTLKLPTDAFDHYQLLAKTAQFEIAETHFEAGNYKDAAKFFSRLRLLDLAPVDRARAHFKSAYSLQLAGELEGCITQIRQYLEQWPQDENVPEARFILATTLRKLGRADEALAETFALLSAEQKQSSADLKRWAYWQRRTGNQLANDLFHSGDIANAMAIYQGLAAMSQEPGWQLPSLYQLGLCQEQLRANERAKTSYESIVESVRKLQNPPAELNELAKMAAWRLSNMEWHDKADRKMVDTFSTTTGKTPTPPIPAPAHDAPPSAAAAPGSL